MIRFLVHVCMTLLVAAIVGVGGMAMAKRIHTGTWSLPSKNDYVWLRRAFRRQSEPPRIIYLQRESVQLMGGWEDSHDNRSQLLAQGDTRSVPGFTGSRRAWSRIVRCVRDKFAAFDVAITDERPARRGYVLVHVGGRPRDLFGQDRKGTGGVAPYNGHVIPDAMVFAFSRTLGNRIDAVCETIAHEIGHVYGLDHSYRCNDLMTYLERCGERRFLNAAVRCGESGRRDCEDGSVTQNSYRHLLHVLGPSQRGKRHLVAAR